MFGDDQFWIALKNTLQLFLIIPLCLLIGLMLALLMDQGLKGTGAFRNLILLPFALSYVVTGTVWAWMYNPSSGIINSILKMLAPAHIKGLTLLGGEPFEPQNQPAILNLLRQVKEKYPEKTIWAYSGYLFDRDILACRLGPVEITKEYVSYLDVIVDGPFIQSRKNLSLRFRGSDNQRIIDVKASLASGEIVLWQDWQTEGKGLRK